MSRPAGWLERLLANGEYARLARECKTDAEIAARLGGGATGNSVRKARAVLRARGFNVPLPGHVEKIAATNGDSGKDSFQSRDPDLMAYIADTVHRSAEEVEVDVSEWDEKTNPAIVINEPEQISRVEEHRLKRRVRELESELRKLTEQLSDGGEYSEVIREVLARQHESPPPEIAPRERTSGLREATPLVLASDWHIEEEVRPEQVAGRNRYNLDISTQRMQRFFESARWGIAHQREVFKIRDFIGWWGGDLITNFLHDDNIESNLLHPTEAILMAERNIIAGIDYLLDDPEIERFVFPCNDGNHGRLTDKTRAATRTQNSLEVFLYAQLAHHYRNEPRVRFILPTSAFTFLDNVYGRTIRFTHGDAFNYSGGVGGITIPLNKALARWESVKRADLTCLGHWHQRICLPNVMVNGSLIGFNAYAMAGGFPFEPPVQSMRMLDAQRWCSTDIPMWVSERADDDADWRAA